MAAKAVFMKSGPGRKRLGLGVVELAVRLGRRTLHRLNLA